MREKQILERATESEKEIRVATLCSEMIKLQFGKKCHTLFYIWALFKIFS